MTMEESRDDTRSSPLRHRLANYYATKAASAYERMDPEKTNWERPGVSLKGWMNQFTGGLDLPFKSIVLFAGSWMLLEIGWPLLIVFGVATAGTVWSIPTAIPCLFIAVYVSIMISGMNMVRSIITQLGDRKDNLVKALFRGYFWSLLSIGVILTIHEYFHSTMPQLFFLPILYLIPIEVLGTTVPIPLLLGFSGLYMDISVTIIVYAIGITGSSIGGIEILRNLLDNSRQRGTYGAIFGVLLLAVFPVVNIYFSLVFLTSTLDLFGRCLSFGA
jgi:hypothetical protein